MIVVWLIEMLKAQVNPVARNAVRHACYAQLMISLIIQRSCIEKWQTWKCYISLYGLLQAALGRYFEILLIAHYCDEIRYSYTLLHFKSN